MADQSISNKTEKDPSNVNVEVEDARSFRQPGTGDSDLNTISDASGGSARQGNVRRPRSIKQRPPLPDPYSSPSPWIRSVTDVNDLETGDAINHERFVAVDPFGPSVAQSLVNMSTPALPIPSTFHVRPIPLAPAEPSSLIDDVLAFLVDTLPRQLYLNFLLHLPKLYFSRVTRIFEEAELSMPEIIKMAIASLRHKQHYDDIAWHLDSPDPAHSQAFSDLKLSWEAFIDSAMKEWKTLNIVAVLLLTAILTTLQINSAAVDPIIRNTALLSLICALMSILCGCMYTIRFNAMRNVYKAAVWAQEAQKTRTVIWWNVWVFLAMPAIWLAWSILLYLVCIMAFVWRTGSQSVPVVVQSPEAELAARLVITAIFALGMIYLSLIVSTLRRYGDDAMDESWKLSVLEWAKNHHVMNPSQSPFGNNSYSLAAGTSPHKPAWHSQWTYEYVSNQPSLLQPDLYSPLPVIPEAEDFPSGSNTEWREDVRPLPHSLVPLPSVSQLARVYDPPRSGIIYPVPYEGIPPQVFRSSLPVDSTNPAPFNAIKLLDLRFWEQFVDKLPAEVMPDLPDIILLRGIEVKAWRLFISVRESLPEFLANDLMEYKDAKLAWRKEYGPLQQRPPLTRAASHARPQDIIARLLEWWNFQFFYPRKTGAVLCEEFSNTFPCSSAFAIYLVDYTLCDSRTVAEMFGPIPKGLYRIDLYGGPSYTDPYQALRKMSIYSEGRPPLSKLLSFRAIKMVDLRPHNPSRVSYTMPNILLHRDILVNDWERFIEAAITAWDGQAPLPLQPWGGPQYAVGRLLEKWNKCFFYPRGTQAALSQEFPATNQKFAGSPSLAVYLMDLAFDNVTFNESFGPLPAGMNRIDIFEFREPRNPSKIVGGISLFPAAGKATRIQDQKAHTPGAFDGVVEGTSLSGGSGDNINPGLEAKGKEVQRLPVLSEQPEPIVVPPAP